MTDLEQLLATEFESLGGRAPHDPDLAGSVRGRARRQATVLASVLAVLVLVGGIGLATARLRGPGAPTAAAPTATAPTTGCPALHAGTLPVWARAGFSTPDPGIPLAYSRDGRMLAIVFGYPLTAPPAADHSNKILWVAKVGSTSPFTIDARLEGSTLRVRRDVGLAPGPSIVDLPAAGCWQLVLHWGGYTDTMSLRYAAG
jgi:hypothetical protein